MVTKRTLNTQLRLTPKYLAVLLVCAMILLPLLIFFIASFKSVGEFAKSGIMDLPKEPVLDNYQRVLERGGRDGEFVGVPALRAEIVHDPAADHHGG